MFTPQNIGGWLAEIKNNPKASEAHYNLALANLNASIKTDKTHQAAIFHLDKAAELNHPTALYHIAQNYRFGRLGKEKSDEQATIYLKRAAEYGSHEAIGELQREQGMVQALQTQAYNTQIYKQNAESIFRRKAGLDAAIQTYIFPAVVFLKTTRGVVGTGFFQHSNWLVSNAHVFSSASSLENAMVLDSTNNKALLDIQQSFHRPNDFVAPDVSVVNVKSRGNGNTSCIPPFYQEGSGGYGHTEEIFFYVYFSQTSGQIELRYLGPCINPGQLPYQFLCADNDIPESGSSGAPLIGARVITSKDPQWTFEIKGIVYARCASSNAQQKHLVAIPIDTDFKQLFDILRAKDSADRAAQMSHASQIMKNDSQQRFYASEEQRHLATFQRHFEAYEHGVTDLYIDLPAGLEELGGTDIIGFEDSLLLEKNQKKLLHKGTIDKERGHKFKHSLKTTQDLIDDYEQLMGTLTRREEIKLPSNLNTLPGSTYFRIDMEGVSKNGKEYIIKLQDNTGKFKINGHLASSDFAIAKIPISFKSISGQELVKLIRESVISGQGEVYKPAPTFNNNNNRQ